MMLKRSIFLHVALLLIFVTAASAQFENRTSSANQQTDRPLKVKRKPEASPMGFYLGTSGAIRLRVTFDQSGVIGDIEPLGTSGCDSFDRSAIRAAKKIEFDPAIKEGKPITVTKLVEYVYASR